MSAGRFVPWTKKPRGQNLRLNASHYLHRHVRAFYVFNTLGKLVNIASNRHHGTLVNGPTLVTDTDGTHLDFEESSNHYADCGTGVVLRDGDCTFLAIGKFESFATADCRVISKADGVATADHDFMAGTVNAGGFIVPRVRFSTASGSQTAVVTGSSSSEINLGERTMFGGIRTGSGITAFKLDTTTGWFATTAALASGDIRQSTRPFHIGENGDGYGNYDGSLEAVIILDGIALVQSQFRTIFANPWALVAPRVGRNLELPIAKIVLNDWDFQETNPVLPQNQIVSY